MSPRRNDESGAVAVIFAILVVFLLIPIGAIVVDVGFWYTNAKKTQNAADAAALAGASQLPSGPVVATAEAYAERNLPSVDVANDVHVNPGYDGDGDGIPEVEVSVTHPAPTFFGKVFGVLGVESTRRAAAEQWRVPGSLAIYVHGEDCDAGESLYFTGANMHIEGWVHSQGGLHVSVADDPTPNLTASRGTMAFDPTSPGTKRCMHDIQPLEQSADFQLGDDWLPEGTNGFDWPVFYTPSQFGWYRRAMGAAPSPTRCRFRGNRIEIENARIVVRDPGDPDQIFNFSAGLLPTGVYCAREIVEFTNSNNLRGRITVLAEEIKTNATDRQLDLTAYAGSPDPVLFFSVPNSTGWVNNPVFNYAPSTAETADDGPPPVCTHDKLITFTSGVGTDWSGLIFHPCGKVYVNQTGTTGTGAIVAEQFHVNGSEFELVGDNNFSATIELALVE